MQTRKVPAMRTRIYTREGKNRRKRGGGQKMKTAEKLTKPQSPCTVFCIQQENNCTHIVHQ